jgi:glycosyltransferase involved in cell wall biosynthesis
MRHVVVMITTSYPRFPGDGVGSFMEPIAKGVAARGHEVHLVAPWHPAVTRSAAEDGVHFHFFRYAPTDGLHVFGYASGLRADTEVKRSAWAVAPAALLSGWFKAKRVADKRGATVVHAHWVIPGGVIGAMAAGPRPLVVSLHGSDVFIAERHALARRAARAVFRRAAWVTACTDDLRERGLTLGAGAAVSETVPYGVDTRRFTPDPATRTAVRRELGVGEAPLVVSAGRLVRKKGFEYLIDAAAEIAASVPGLRVVIAGDGDLRAELEGRARAALPGAVRLLGTLPQSGVVRLAAAADVVVVPSVRDEAGNVDGLPNFSLEASATATPVVASRAGGLPQLIEDGVTGRLVPERDSAAIARAVKELLANPERARALGAAGRRKVEREFGWARVAERFDAAYARVALRTGHST